MYLSVVTSEFAKSGLSEIIENFVKISKQTINKFVSDFAPFFHSKCDLKQQLNTLIFFLSDVKFM